MTALASCMKVTFILILWYISSAKSVAIGRLRYTWRVILLDKYGYSKYFQTEPGVLQSSQWTLKVDTEMYGIDFITFFATDHHRPLDYSCAFSHALCDFSITKGTHDPRTQQTTVSAYLKHPVHLAVPSMAGNLMICTGPVDMFWKRPLIVDGPIHPHFELPTTSSGKYFCEKIDPAVPPNNDIIIPPSTSIACPLQSFSCSDGIPVRPNIQASELPDLEVHTWYMTKENYRDMRLGKIANVIIPLFENNYMLHLYGTIDRPHNETCEISTPLGLRIPIEISDTKLNRLKYPIAASQNNSGVYSMGCYIAYNDTIEGFRHRPLVNKSLNITFIRGPKIYLDGENGYVKHFPSNITSTDILILVYTTSPLVSFEVTQEAKSISDRIFASFLSNSPYEIIWKHNIKVSKLDYETNGVYEIRVQNEDGETATQQFTIKKAKLLTVFASPVKLEVEVGSQAKLECAVIGNLIEKLEWSRDIEDTIKDENILVTDVRHGDQESKGLKLTIESVRMENSGIYECRASNRYQRVTKSVELIVWPTGGPYLSYNTTKFRIPPEGLQPGPTVLDIFEEEIIREYGVHLTKKTDAKPSQRFLDILLGLVSIIALDVAVSILVITCYLCMCRKEKNQIVEVSTSNLMSYQSSESEELEFEEARETSITSFRRKVKHEKGDKKKMSFTSN